MLVLASTAGAAQAANRNLSELIAPQVVEPADNPSKPAKVALGERLFSETALSIDDSYSCASCHDPARHFTDQRPVALGVSGQLHQRNTPTLYNVAFNASFGWDDQGITRLEAQHLVPLFNSDPVEMGYDANLAQPRLQARGYAPAFAAAFSKTEIETLPLTTLVVRALASYVRTLRHPHSAFDDYMYWGDTGAMSQQAVAGLELFTSPRLGCSGCHAGFSLSGPSVHAESLGAAQFHHTGVQGSRERFRAPTLRAIRFTAPYMHAGNLATLEEVLDHYQTTTATEVPSFTLTELEEQQLLAFLDAL